MTATMTPVQRIVMVSTSYCTIVAALPLMTSHLKAILVLAIRQRPLLRSDAASPAICCCFYFICSSLALHHSVFSVS